MIQERYCSYEISKLLKEKGFDEKITTYYDLYYDNTIVLCHGSKFKWNESPMGQIAAPTHQMAIDWLREKHGIFIEIFSSIDLNGNYHYSYNVLGSDCKYIRKGYTSFDWEYKDAVEAALKYCITELIK